MFARLSYFLSILVCFSANNSFKSELKKQVCKDGHVDAATQTRDGKLYLFRGDYSIKLGLYGIEKDYPKLIVDDWIGMESGSIDAAFTWLDGSTFFFKGDKYWKLVNKIVLEGYPKKISHGFPGIPNNLDAALSWEYDGYLDFFKGDKYWMYRPESSMPVSEIYPRNMSRWVDIPENVTAAVRWADGPTYFFKGSRYYPYINNKTKVPETYEISTAKTWFHCEKGSMDREYFDNPKYTAPTKDIISKLDEINHSIRTIMSVRNSVAPPSTGSTIPLIIAAWSLGKNRTASAMLSVSAVHISSPQA